MLLTPAGSIWPVILFFLSTCFLDTLAADLFAHYSSHGIRGSVKITHPAGLGLQGEEVGNHNVSIIINLETYMGVESATYNWAVYELPVEYTQPITCDKGYLGERIIDLTPSLGQVSLPTTEPVVFNTSLFSRTGPNSLWSRTLVLEGPRTLCATIMPAEGLKISVARLSTPVAGSVMALSWSVDELVDTRIVTDLYHVAGDGTASNHVWKLMVTDVLDTKADRDRGDCNALQFLYDPDSRSGDGCSPQQPGNCKQGDLSGRLGLVRVASRPGGGFGGGSRRAFRDALLTLPDLSGPRSLYLVLFDKEIPDLVLACGKFRELRPRRTRATFNQKGVGGDIVMKQRSPIDATRVLVNLTGLSAMAGGFHVHEYPVPIARTGDDKVCGATANHYNPWGWTPSDSPPPGTGSGEMYELGDLSGKFGMLTGLTNAENDVVDTTLPLFGPYSIQGRGLVVHLASDGSRWVCANVEPVGVKMTTAMAIFRYPLGGRVIFRQAADDPLSETTVFVESLIYSDGAVNETAFHQFEIHSLLPDEDYHEWRNRCSSTGSVFNPFRVTEKMANDCNTDTQRRCVLGDLTRKHGRLTVAGLASGVKSTVRLFTDTNLPLSGPQSIVGRSIVVFDDNSPKQRGNRLACTPINFYHRHKTVVKDWFGNGFATPVDGKIEMIQETEFSGTSIQMDLTGLGGEAGRYGVYVAPLRPDLQFPCTEAVLGNVYNPLMVSKESQQSVDGTADYYPVGDLSSKFGHLTGFKQVHAVFNDTNLPLYGATSVVGRSVVLNRATDNERWTCGTLGWGFSPSEAEEVKAIASFHHPGGFAWGYVRFSQVVYRDGSATDTVIEVNLKHPGKQNRNVTLNHRWAVYVNPVGQDASVAPFNARCVASGYMWNPGFVQLTDPRNEDVYRQECQPHVPFRCMVGDLAGRLGNINVGQERYVFSDRNLPLYGKLSVMGRSLILLTPNNGGDRFACANIEPDRDIFKFVVIRKPRKFVASEFIEDVRRVLNVPEWMLVVDARQTKDIQNGRCVQFKVHFQGPSASRIEQDLSQLLAKGQLDAPSIQAHGAHLDPNRKKTIPYHVCDESDNTAAPRPSTNAAAAAKRDTMLATAIALAVLAFVVLI